MTQAQVPRRKRVLLVTDEMEVGGTQRQIVYIATGLDRTRFEPTVLFFRNPSFFVDELKQAGVRVIQVEKQGRIDFRFVRELVRVLRDGQFDVMQCFAFSGELWGTVARRLLPASQRPALITSVRGVYEWYSRTQWRIKRWVSSQSERVIANSKMGADYAASMMNLAPAAIRVSYNGVATPAAPAMSRDALRHSMGIAAGELLVLFVGRLVVHKDVPTLLKACASVQAQHPQIRLRLAGDGPLMTEFADEITHLGLAGKALLMGQRDDVTDLIEAADVLVLPSLREGLSNVILEGMMGGKAVVASRAGGNVELVQHEKTGLLFDVGDVAGLAQALGRLAKDEPLRRQLGDGARLRAEREFSIPSMVQAYETHYDEAANNGLRRAERR